MSGQQRKPRITPLENGPLKVEGLARLTNPRQEPLPVKKTLLLCRCGGSKKRPFCDGTHARIAFCSDPKPGKVPDRRRDYAGRALTIYDNRGICSHAEHCTQNSPEVFRRGRKPWIDPEAEEPGKTIATIEMCPSGALSYSVDGREHRDRQAEAEIQVERNGPYRVRGGVELAGHALGEGASLEHYTLCRCGRSCNLPRCDGSHRSDGFTDEGQALL